MQTSGLGIAILLTNSYKLWSPAQTLYKVNPAEIVRGGTLAAHPLLRRAWQLIAAGEGQLFFCS